MTVTRDRVQESGEIRIGISSCLLGEKVRFDGGHKQDHFITDTMGRFVSFVAVCPEVEVGMGTPRETIRLERRDGGIRLVAPKSGADHTQAMAAWARKRVEDLEALDLCGYILKKDSPSCGMERVRVYGEGGMPDKSGRGLFAAVLLERFPLLPVEEEGRLNDPWLRENFLERVFAYRRLKALFGKGWRVGDLVAFHSREKLLLMAHHPPTYTALGRLVGGAKGRMRQDVEQEYREGFMTGLRHLATVKKNTNVLLHMAGYFKTLLGPEEKSELQGHIEDYRQGLVPLVVPVTLFRHYVRLHKVTYLAGQTYLQPHPKELMLRNHV
jgi:uncharacterized protein YbgA (DUF1722 family)/uncharacterized protein YbbK (DUF523 family)